MALQGVPSGTVMTHPSLPPVHPQQGKVSMAILCLHSAVSSGAHTVVPNTAGWRWSLSPSFPVLLARSKLDSPETGWPGSLAGRGPRCSAPARAASSPARGGRQRHMSCSSSARGCSCLMSLSLWCTAACRLWTVASEVSSCSWRAAISLAGKQNLVVMVPGDQRGFSPYS